MHLQILAITINPSLIGHDRYYEAGFGAGTPQQEAVPMGWKFSRIENLWPRDGSCPLPLRSKRIFNKCFRIVKTQKISRGCAAHVMGIAVCSERSSCPCLCSGVVRLAHTKCEVMAQYLVQTAYVRFKVQYEESRAQCGHYVRLLSSIRITL